jgi:hypothetical protein
MTLQDEIARLRTRIAAARAERDGAQGSGAQSRYLDAVSRLEGLERDLEALRREGHRALASHGAMAELGIRLDRGLFCVGGARYERLEDAVKFARELRAPKNPGRRRS